MKIVKIMNRNHKRRVITDKELEEYRKEYLKEAEDLIEKTKRFKMSEILLEKMLSPFEYWLTDKFQAEDYKAANPEIVKSINETKEVKKVIRFSGVENVKEKEAKRTATRIMTEPLPGDNKTGEGVAKLPLRKK